MQLDQCTCSHSDEIHTGVAGFPDACMNDTCGCMCFEPIPDPGDDDVPPENPAVEWNDEANLDAIYELEHEREDFR